MCAAVDMVYPEERPKLILFSTQIDRCGLMWIIDSGAEGVRSICPPKLVVFDLNNNDREICK